MSHDALTTSTNSVEPRMYPQFLLFGDSITQDATHILAPALSWTYHRHLDVLNRGFSGYNSVMGYTCLPHFFPAIPPSPTNPRVRLMTVFFGANDAVVPPKEQHLSIETYVSTLKKIVTYEGVKLHGTKIILIVPGPVNEWGLENNHRNPANTARYAAACRAVGAELNLPTLDLWTIFMKRAGWKEGDADLIGSKNLPKNEELGSLLWDGLHFTEKAYRIVYEELMELIRDELPAETPANIPWLFPDWRTVLGVPQP